MAWIMLGRVLSGLVAVAFLLVMFFLRREYGPEEARWINLGLLTGAATFGITAWKLGAPGKVTRNPYA